MDMLVDGVAPGAATEAHLRPMLLVLRSIGAALVWVLYGASLAVDGYVKRVAGVSINVVELLILVGVLAQAMRVVRPACSCSGQRVWRAPHSRLSHAWGRTAHRRWIVCVSRGSTARADVQFEQAAAEYNTQRKTSRLFGRISRVRGVA